MISNGFSITDNVSAVQRWVRFLSVGAIGLGVQLWALMLLLHLDVEPVLASLLAVEAAVLNNFPLHRAWTWKDRPAPTLGVELRRLARFHLSSGGTSLLGLGFVQSCHNRTSTGYRSSSSLFPELQTIHSRREKSTSSEIAR